MTLHPQAQAFIDLITLNPRPGWEELGVDRAREVFLTFDPFYGEAPELSRVEDLHVGDGVNVRLYSDRPGPAPAIMYFHGGGWVLGNLDSHDALCRRFARDSQCTVVAVDYRLSPESACPGPIEDCFRATRYVVEHADSLGIDASRIVVAGDSAGGHLATSVAIKARDASGPQIAMQVMLYPVIEPDFETQSYRQFESGFGLTRNNMRWFWEQFLGASGNSPGAVPTASTTLSGLPPAIVVTAEYDVLRDEGDRYAALLRDAGVEVDHRQIPGMLHGFIHFAAMFDTGIEVGRQVARTIASRV